MELRVSVDGIERVVCGVTSQTTCREIIQCLARATGSIGRFLLVEHHSQHQEDRVLPADLPICTSIAVSGVCLLTLRRELNHHVQQTRSDDNRAIQLPSACSRRLRRKHSHRRPLSPPHTLSKEDVSPCIDSLPGHTLCAVSNAVSATSMDCVTTNRSSAIVGVVRGVPQEGYGFCTDVPNNVSHTNKASIVFSSPVSTTSLVTPPPYREPPPPRQFPSHLLQSSVKESLDNGWCSTITGFEYVQLTRMISERQKIIDGLKTDIKKHDIEMEFLDRLHVANGSQLKALKEETSQLERLFNERQQEMISIEKEEQTLLKELNEHSNSHTELNLLKKRLQDCTEDLETYRDKLRRLEQELTNERESVVLAERDCMARLVTQLSSVQREQAGVQEERVRLEMQLGELSGQLLERRRRLAEMRGELRQLNLSTLESTQVSHNAADTVTSAATVTVSDPCGVWV